MIVEPKYNRDIQNEIEDFLCLEHEICVGGYSNEPVALGAYLGVICEDRIDNSLPELFKRFTDVQIQQCINGLIGDGYLSPTFKLLGLILQRKLDNKNN